MSPWDNERTMTLRLPLTGIAAALTVTAGVAVFLVVDVLRPETRAVTFEAEATNVGPLEALNGTQFTRANGVATITEPFAHVSLPLRRTLFGKRLVIRPRFHLDEGDVLEVGVKKTDFWLDYDRLPLRHRVLDNLLTRDESTWSALRSGTRIAYVNPRYENPWKTLEEFEAAPPTDGPVGLYGNSVLPIPHARGPMLETAPFRVTDDPDEFRAIYAWYPEPDRSDPEWTVNEQRFDLARAYQNEDGSIDVMFFVQRHDTGPIRVLVDAVEFRIEPGWPKARDLLGLIRRNLVRIIRRPPVAQNP